MSGAPPGASVSSRFVSQAQLSEAQERRQREIRDAYERIGKSPPPEENDAAPYDPRTLYEQLKANKDAKEAAVEERNKLSNQFRGIDASESQFLSEVELRRRKEDDAKRRAEEQELERFRREAEQRTRASKGPRVVPASASASASTSTSASAPVSAPALQPGAPAASLAPKLRPTGKRKRDTLGLGIVRKKPPPSSEKSAVISPSCSPTTSASKPALTSPGRPAPLPATRSTSLAASASTPAPAPTPTPTGSELAEPKPSTASVERSRPPRASSVHRPSPGNDA